MCRSKKNHLKLFLVEKADRLRTVCERERFHAGGSQNLANHLADGFFIIHDQNLLLHSACSWQRGDKEVAKRG